MYCSKELTFNKPDAKPIITPIVGLDNAVIKETDNIAPVAIGLNEIYRVFEEPEGSLKQQLPDDEKETSDKSKRKPPVRIPLSKLVNDAKKIQILNDEIQRQVGGLSGPSIFFTEYKGKRYPEKIEREFILHTEHTFSEVPCLPITPNIANSINEGKLSFDKYVVFISESIDWLQSYRKKPIMGIIHAFSYTNIDKLMKLYVNKGINAFCIDFDCRTPASRMSVLAQCHRSLGEKAETSFFYGINVNEGRFIHKKTVINAKNVLAFGFGIDAIGRRHRPPRFPSKEQREKLGSKWKPLDRKENKVRLFIKTDYGYYKVQNANDIKNYPLDSSIPLDIFTKKPYCVDDNVRHCEKVFNMEQLAIEGSTLRAIIEKEVPTKYLSGKEHTDEADIDRIKEFKQNVKNQRNIDDPL